MSLRNRLAIVPETIQEFTGAAEDRYWEGRELFVAGKYHGSIYLLGYVAEMLLKSAYFSSRGERLTSLISPMLAPAWSRGVAWFPGLFLANRRDFHNLDFWTKLLLEERKIANKPLPNHLDLQYHANKIHLNWCVDMRYHHSIANNSDAQDVFNSVSWLREHYADLAI